MGRGNAAGSRLAVVEGGDLPGSNTYTGLGRGVFRHLLKSCNKPTHMRENYCIVTLFLLSFW